MRPDCQCGRTVNVGGASVICSEALVTTKPPFAYPPDINAHGREALSAAACSVQQTIILEPMISQTMLRYRISEFLTCLGLYLGLQLCTITQTIIITLLDNIWPDGSTILYMIGIPADQNGHFREHFNIESDLNHFQNSL